MAALLASDGLGGLWAQPTAAVLVLALLCLAAPGAAAAGVYNVRDYGAKGDGKALDTEAINKAVEACASQGGGKVLLPPGRYRSGTVHLKSHVTLQLDAGATLVGDPDPESYQFFTPPKDTPEGRFNPKWHRALVLGVAVEDVAVLGPGVIDGNKVFDPTGEERMRGPHTILFGNSRDLTIRNLDIRDSANYAVMLEGCDRVEVKGLRVTGGWDGVHFRGWPNRPCRDVKILDSQFYTGDDCIAGRYWADTLIAGCVLNSSCNAVRLIGPAERLVIHDCLMYGPGLYPHRTSDRHNMLAGLCLQPGAWDPTEGRLDKVAISNITLRNVSTPFFFTLRPGNTAGRIEVDRVTATGVYRAAGSVESWAETPFEQVIFRDVTLEFEGGGSAEQAEAEVKAPGTDARPLPAWALYARKVRDLRLENVRLTLAEPDARPVGIFEEVAALTLEGFRYPRVEGVETPLVLRKVDRVARSGSDPRPGADP